jgi:hypothetical protein
MVFAVQAEEAANDEVGNIGVGYQGIFMDDMIMNGVAIRGTPAPIGWQIELAQGDLDDDSYGSADFLVLKGKAYYALIERQNSVFYTGASIGYWMAEDHPDADWKIETDGWSIAPLIGAEWSFSELPELGFNFEVSYEFNSLEFDDDDPGANPDSGDIDISGINVSTGVTYYF